MNIQQFQYVLAVAEFKHFETASEACFVTQSTLSTMINRLESEIEVKIFNRKTKPVSVTKEGREIIEQLRIITKEIDALRNIVQEQKGEAVGELHIGVIPTVAPDLLPLFLADFAKRFPKVKVVVREMTTPEIQKSLKNRTIDVGVLAIPLLDEELVELDLYIEPFLMYDCSGGKVKKAIKLDELDYSKLWLLEEGHCLRTQVQQICDLSSKQEGKNIEFKAGSLNSLIRITKANNGLTILPYLSSLELSKEDKSKLVSFVDLQPVRSIGLVTYKHFVKKRLLNSLQETIQASVSSLLPKTPKIKVVNPLI